MNLIKENLNEVKEKIKRACERAGRSYDDVTLIAVSKTKPVEAVREAMEWGMMEFGENKVQELTFKYEQLPKSIHWHLIGHLQRNKVKYIIGKTSLIHSVDSYRLAEEIHKEGQKHSLQVPVLIQVNAANEESKFGISMEECIPLIEKTAKLEYVSIKGLMTIAPFVENPEDNRQYFKQLKQLSVDIKTKNIDNVSMDFLSMGMTGDYEVAVEEGATHIRVGTGIFGERDYSQMN